MTSQTLYDTSYKLLPTRIVFLHGDPEKINRVENINTGLVNRCDVIDVFTRDQFTTRDVVVKIDHGVPLVFILF